VVLHAGLCCCGVLCSAGVQPRSGLVWECSLQGWIEGLGLVLPATSAATLPWAECKPVECKPMEYGMR
jgi:hypothetical protein